jgi:hypothetical protein
VLNHGGLSTLLVDLLTKEEEAVDLPPSCASTSACWSPA